MRHIILLGAVAVLASAALVAGQDPGVGNKSGDKGPKQGPGADKGPKKGPGGDQGKGQGQGGNKGKGGQGGQGDKKGPPPGGQGGGDKKGPPPGGKGGDKKGKGNMNVSAFESGDRFVMFDEARDGR